MVDSPLAAAKIDYTGRDEATLRAQLQAFVGATSTDPVTGESLQTDFLDTTLGQVLIRMLSFTGDVLSYGQDIAALEHFPATARRRESLLRYARSFGYVPRPARAASVLMQSDSLPANLIVSGGTIAQGVAITSSSGAHYELLAPLVIPPGTSTLSVKLYEGFSFEEVFTPTPAPRQEFVTQQGIVAADSWHVFVGVTSDPANLWTQVSNVIYETGATKVYQVTFDTDGKLHVLFGDGDAGKIPDQAITIRYRTTTGANGNAQVGTVSGAMTAAVPGGLLASVALTNLIEPASGGVNRETVDELRRNIKAFIPQLDQVRTLLDYAAGVMSVQGVALAFADVPQASFSGNIVRVHVWDREVVPFTATSPLNGVTSTVDYGRYLPSPSSRAYDVQQYLIPRTLACVHNLIVRPTVAQVDLDLGPVRYSRVRSVADIHLDIVAAIVKLFETSSGFIIRISDIYEAVQGVNGVRSLLVQKVIFEHVDFDTGVGTIVDEYRNDQTGGFEPLQDIIIPGAVAPKFYDDSFLYSGEIVYDGDFSDTVVQAINLRTLLFNLQL